jgi:ATP/maltotriose-dependent transcriptional regulator MalT
MSQVADPLVGRPGELAVLEEALTGLDEDHSTAIELVGEPGIGKTRLLAELADRADARGHLVLSGSASELERDLPFWVFVDALDEYAEGLEPQRVGRLDAQSLAELGHVLPSLSDHAAGGPPVLRDERYRTHRAVRELLAVLGDGQPLVLILDDLHWADSGSAELVGALLRRPPAATVLLALALRPRQTPTRLAATFDRAHRAGRLVRLELAALSRAESRELLGTDTDEIVAGALHDESGGNPFYLEQLARSVDRRGGMVQRPDEAALAGVEVPAAVAASLTEELELLSDAARLVLRGAAVAGDPFEPELVAAAAGIEETDAIEPLDELLRTDLIRPTDVPRRFRFRHPLVRRAVYESSPGGWRLGAHERSAEALARRGASAAVRAHHVESCGRQGDAGAVAVLREAADEAARRTPEGAARWLQAALRLLSDDAPPEERVELLMALAGAQAATGQFVEARAALLEGLDLLPEGAELHVPLTAACATMDQLLGRHSEAHARLVGALDELEDQGSAQAAALMITLALDSFFRRENADSREWGLRALTVARAVGDPPLAAAAAAAVALACSFVGAIEEAETYRAEAATLVDGMTDAQLAVRLDAMAYLTGAEAYMDRFEESKAHGERGFALARSTGQGELLPLMIPAHATVLMAQGRLDEAASMLDGAVEGARLAGNLQALAWDLMNRSFIAVLAGDLEIAVATAQESFDLTRPLGDSFVSTYASLMLGIARQESGDHERALELFLSLGGEGLSSVSGVWRGKYLDLLTRLWLTLGRTSEAERTSVHAADLAAETGLRTASVWADRAAAAVALEAGDAGRAAELALASTATADSVGAPLEAALSRTLAGRALAALGQTDRAVSELEQAVAALDACGAKRYRLEAERELRKLGRKVYRRSARGSADDGLASLTERELQLARLVVDRKTNPQIAAELFLSPKTVETHLRNIFRKVGVANRVELARAVEQSDRAVPGET